MLQIRLAIMNFYLLNAFYSARMFYSYFHDQPSSRCYPFKLYLRIKKIKTFSFFFLYGPGFNENESQIATYIRRKRKIVCSIMVKKMDDISLTFIKIKFKL